MAGDHTYCDKTNISAPQERSPSEQTPKFGGHPCKRCAGQWRTERRPERPGASPGWAAPNGYFARIRGLREGPYPELELQQFRDWFRLVFHSPTRPVPL